VDQRKDASGEDNRDQDDPSLDFVNALHPNHQQHLYDNGSGLERCRQRGQWQTV
jgi:hypothetical protein